VRWLGRVDYRDALSLQRRLNVHSPDDHLLLLEHPRGVTLGSSARPEHVLLSAGELAARKSGGHRGGRGGDVTYHGPGQLVGYPVLDLKPDRRDVHAYLRGLEQVLIDALRAFGLSGDRDAAGTGVWVSGAKVAALGIRVSSRWITSHGFALNAATNLNYFASIVPCGIPDRPVTSLTRLLGRDVTPAEAAPVVIEAMRRVFGYGALDDPGGANSL